MALNSSQNFRKKIMATRAIGSQSSALASQRSQPRKRTADISNQAKAAIEQGVVFRKALKSMLSSRKVAAYPFFQGLAQEDLGFREIDHEQKKKWYEEAISYFLKVPKEDSRYQQAQFRHGYCAYRLAIIETDIQKKLDLAQKALHIVSKFDPTHPDFKNASFLQGGCKFELGTYASEEQKKRELLEEASAFFAKVDATDPDPKNSSFRQGEWKYNRSFSAAETQEKRKLLEEAFACFSKNDPTDLTFKEVLLRQGDCKFHLAFCASAPQERQALLQEAFEFYTVVGCEDPQFSDVAWKQGECKFHEAFCELVLEKRRALHEEALGFYKKTSVAPNPDVIPHPNFYKSAFRQGQCKYQLALYLSSPLERGALLTEAFECFLTIPPYHPLFRDISLNLGDCRFQLAFCAPENSEERPKFLQQAFGFYADCHPQTREIRWLQGECKFQQALCNSNSPGNRQLYEEAIVFFADLSPDHPKYKELLYFKALSQFMCANFEADFLMKQQLVREALNCYSQINSSDGPIFEAAQSMIKQCNVLLYGSPAEREYLF